MISILKMKGFLLHLFLWSVCCAQATPKDTLYHVRFVSAADSTPLCFAILKAKSSGVVIASWEADAAGYIRINQNQIRRDPHALISLQYPGFAHRAFKADTLTASDTILLTIKPQPVMLDAIMITAYKVPMIEKTRRARHRRHKPPEETPEAFPVYSPEYCQAYEALQKGLWLSKDSASRRSILAWDSLSINDKDMGGSGMALMLRHYFMQAISYPRQARDFLMEETVYLCFEFGEKGEVNYLQVMRGKHVDLVLEAANALARVPRLNLKDVFSDYGESYPPKRLKPVRMLLPVKFILR